MRSGAHMKPRLVLMLSTLLLIGPSASNVWWISSVGGHNVLPMIIDSGLMTSYDIRPYTRGNTSNFPLYPKSNAAEPSKGNCVLDGNFGTEVCKAVDKTEFATGEIVNVVRPVYSRWRIDNSLGDLYYLVKDGETPEGSGRGQMAIFWRKNDSLFKIATDVNGDEGAEFRWDYSGRKPYTMYYVEGCQFREYDVVTTATRLVRDFSNDFPGCGRILNGVEGDSSADSRYWTWMVQGQYDGASFPMIAIVTYDKQTDTILGILDNAKYKAMGGADASLPTPNMVDISPLGTKVVALFGRTDTNDLFDGPHAYALDFSSPIKVCNDETHSGWAFDYNGNEVFVCQVNASNWPNADSDTVAYTNIRTGETEVIVYHEDLGWDVGGFHFGRFYNSEIKGWVYMTTYSEYDTSTSWLRNQAVMLELIPYTEHPRIWRITDTHNNYPGDDGYPREAYSPMSGDGRTIYWGADWPGGDRTVDTYKVQLPDDWWLILRTATKTSSTLATTTSEPIAPTTQLKPEQVGPSDLATVLSNPTYLTMIIVAIAAVVLAAVSKRRRPHFS